MAVELNLLHMENFQTYIFKNKINKIKKLIWQNIVDVKKMYKN